MSKIVLFMLLVPFSSLFAMEELVIPAISAGPLLALLNDVLNEKAQPSALVPSVADNWIPLPTDTPAAAGQTAQSNAPRFITNPQEAKKTAKNGWNLANGGSFAQAEQVLDQAANLGSLKAALFLSQAYTSGSFCIAQNLEKANQLGKLIDQLKELKKAERIKKEQESPLWKQTPEEAVQQGEWWFRNDMEKLERAAKNKHALIETHGYLRQNPWFQQVIDFLSAETNYSPFYSYKSRKFKMPTVENAALHLVKLAINREKPSPRGLELLKITIASCPQIPAVYESMLQALDSAYSAPALEVRKQLLALVTPWAQEKNLEQLKKCYSRYVSDLYDRYHYGSEQTDEQRDECCNDLLEGLVAYNAIDHDAASKNAHYYTKECLKSIYPGGRRPEWPFRMLATLKQINYADFENFARGLMSSDQCADVLQTFLQHPEIAALFDQTLLSCNLLILNTLQSAEIQQEPKHKAFAAFIRYGAAHHTEYELEILRVLPLFCKNPSDCNNVQPLFASSLPALREAAFQNYLRAIIAITRPFEEYFQEFLINDLLKEINPLHVLDQQKNYLERFYEAVKEKNLDYAIQKIFCQVVLDERAQARLLQSRILREYVEFTDVSSTSTDKAILKKGITSALQRALDDGSNTLPFTRIQQIIDVAHKTGFLTYIDEQFLAAFEEKALLNDHVPLPKRTQFLERFINRQLAGKNLSAVLHSEVDRMREQILSGLVDSPFRRWAENLFAALHPKQSSFSQLAARRALIELHKECAELPESPTILNQLYKRLFNALRERYETPKEPLIHVTVKKDLHKLLFAPGELMYGYVANDDGNYAGNENYYRLYACNKNTGLPVWSSGFQAKEKDNVFGLHQGLIWELVEVKEEKDEQDQSLFVSIFLTYDALNGAFKNQFTLRTKEKIKKMLCSEAGGIYLIANHQLHIIKNEDPGQLYSVELPKDLNTNFVHCLGARIAFPHCGPKEEQGQVAVYDMHGKVYRILTNTERFFCPSIFGNQDMLFIIPHASKEALPELSCFNAKNGDLLWKHQLPASFKKGLMSPDGESVYILTEKTLLSLNTNQDTGEFKRILWETSVAAGQFIREQITEIQLSLDGKALYGLHDYDSGHLYHFDSATGTKLHVYTIGEARAHTFVGFYNNKPYICAYHY